MYCFETFIAKASSQRPLRSGQPRHTYLQRQIPLQQPSQRPFSPSPPSGPSGSALQEATSTAHTSARLSQVLHSRYPTFDSMIPHTPAYGIQRRALCSAMDRQPRSKSRATSLRLVQRRLLPRMCIAISCPRESWCVIFLRTKAHQLVVSGIRVTRAWDTMALFLSLGIFWFRDRRQLIRTVCL